MYMKTSRSHGSAPNYAPEVISDEDLIRGFLLSLGASGRKPKTLETYEDSVRALSAFGNALGFPPLISMDKEHIRHWLMSLYQKGNQTSGIHVRYRSLNRFVGWCVKEGERQSNPRDLVPPCWSEPPAVNLPLVRGKLQSE